MGPGHRKWIGLGFLVYGAMLFFLVTLYRLPTEEVIEKKALDYTGGAVTIRIGKMSSTFPPGYVLENVEYRLLLGSDFSQDCLKSLHISPDYQRLLSGYFPLIIRGVLPGGNYDIKVGLSLFVGLKDGYVTMESLEARLEDFNFLRLLSERDLKGKLRAEMKFRGSLQEFDRINGEGVLLVEDGSITSLTEVLGLKELSFSSLRIPFVLREGLISLRNGEMRGPVLSGSFSGEIQLRKPFGTSPLHLIARLKANPTLIDSGARLPPEVDMGGGSEPIVVRLGGTLKQPTASWDNGQSWN